MQSVNTYLKPLVLAFVCLLGVSLGPSSAAKDSPLAVKQTSERTVSTDVQTQKAVDEWAAEEKQLLEKIDRNERALKRSAWERKKTKEYLATLEKKMIELKEQAAEMEKINAELLPILDSGLERLTTFVQGDLPFDKAGRIENIENAAHILNDYDMGLLAKTRTLFDAVARETDFGYSVDIRETEIEIEGRPIRVNLLKVGRMGLYALTMDGDNAYVWNGRQNQYLPVDSGVKAIDEAVQIVERIRIVELTKLPMGKPSEAPDAGGRRDE